MHTDEAFDIFQRKIDAAAYHVRKARHRRDIFCHALKTLKDVTEAFPLVRSRGGRSLIPSMTLTSSRYLTRQRIQTGAKKVTVLPKPLATRRRR